MRFNAMIIDDFYSNPMEVREFALKQEFKVRGNYPGLRTESFLSEPLKNTMQNIVYPFAGNVTNWGGEYTGSFQYTLASDRSWIHSDSTTDWAAVLYLTPNAPVTAGTGIFKCDKNGFRSAETDIDTEYDEEDEDFDFHQDILEPAFADLFIE